MSKRLPLSPLIRPQAREPERATSKSEGAQPETESTEQKAGNSEAAPEPAATQTIAEKSSVEQRPALPAPVRPREAVSSPVAGTPLSPSAASGPESTPIEIPVSGRPVVKVLPTRRSSDPYPILSPLTVTVEVKIDRDGKVVDARALQNPSNYWSLRAVDAAKQWRYEPAILHGQRVPSVSTIDFHFK